MLKALPPSYSYIGDLIDVLPEPERTVEYLKSKIKLKSIEKKNRTDKNEENSPNYSGCTDHIVNDDRLFNEYIVLREPINVKIGDGRELKATKMGKICTEFEVFDKKCEITLLNPCPPLYGSRVFVRVPEQLRTSKWDNKAKLGVILGYSDVGYRILLNNRVIDARHVDIVEDDIRCIGFEDNEKVNDSKSEMNQNTINESTNSAQNGETEMIPIQNSGNDDSTNEAIQSNESKNWKRAMDNEMESLKKNEAWKLIKKPNDIKVIDVKLVFRKKDENVYKARLVARGFQQEEFINNTYSPVIRMQTLKLLLSFCCQNGELLYISTGTRPDIAFSVNYLSRFQNCYNETHFKYALRVLKYLYLTKNVKLTYNKNDKVDILDCLVDADWAGDTVDRKSTSRYIIRLFGNTIYWKSRKQNSVTKSSTFAEYVALSEAVTDNDFIYEMLKDTFNLKIERPIKIDEDNSGALIIAKNGNFSKNSKYIEVQYHFVSENCNKGNIDVIKIESENNSADILTKALGKAKFIKFREMLKLKE
ncbi:Reverse transcriptase (RNA-dependent DNA polymerase) [Popillia japonica]|uniref:Reverse transcriptase (RNA-dependent DNA polymerase) n=1 Tax=Popillia japonica TaxID=7064 RepID=A0AAW1IC76_POPJA